MCNVGRLLEKVRELGDSASWERFVRVYWRLIFQTAWKAGLSEADAEDVVQETFATVVVKMPGFVYDRDRGAFRSWLLRVTHSRIADFFCGNSSGGWARCRGRMTMRGRT